MGSMTGLDEKQQEIQLERERKKTKMSLEICDVNSLKEIVKQRNINLPQKIREES